MRLLKGDINLCAKLAQATYSNRLQNVSIKKVPYSRKILRAPIFEDFEVFCSTSKILSSNFVKSQELI